MHLSPAARESAIRLREHPKAESARGEMLERPKPQTQVEAVEAVKWLGVRDDFRNWLVSAA
jgi:hypothetical protein